MAKKTFKPQRGQFEVKGVIRGLNRLKEQNKDDLKGAYTKKTSGGKTYRELPFNIESAKGESTRVRLRSFKTENSYFIKTEDNSVKDFPWNDRNKQKEGYKALNRVGFHSKTEFKDDDSGAHLTLWKHTWDAIKYIAENYEDGDTVFVRGNMEYNSYTGDTTYISVEVGSMFLSKEAIDYDSTDFDEDEFIPKREFKQYVIFEDYEKDPDTGQHFIDTRIITDKKGDTAKVRFEVLPKFAKAFSKVAEGTSMYLIGDYYTTPKTGEIDMDSHSEDDEYGFTEVDGYQEDVEKIAGTFGVENHLLVKVVPIKDKDGNLYIKKEEYDIDELDKIREAILEERQEQREEKQNSGGSRSKKSNNKKPEKETEEDWSDLDSDDDDDWD